MTAQTKCGSTARSNCDEQSVMTNDESPTKQGVIR